MPVATPTREQQTGATPLGLALLLEVGGATLVAPPQQLGPGLALLELAAAVPGPRPPSVAACRTRGSQTQVLAVRVEVDALLVWVRARLVGRALPGWRVEHVAWDMLEGTDDAWSWTLRGRDEAGEAVWLRVQLAVRGDGGRVRVRARCCWLLGPVRHDAAALWRALVRRLLATGVTAVAGGLEIDVSRASLGLCFAAAGWRVPAAVGVEVVALDVTAAAVTVRVAVGERWLQDGEDEEEDDDELDPLAEVRVALRGDAGARRRAGQAMQAIAMTMPGLGEVMARARVLALRFVDRETCVAALHEQLRGAPKDAEARWLLVVTQALRGDADGLVAALTGLAALPGSGPTRMRRKLALALVLQRREGGAPEARALLEPMLAELTQAPAELQAAVWRALARARAGDAGVQGGGVEDAVASALGEDGWRRRGETGELRAQVAAALVGSGRAEADTTDLLRRMLGDERPVRTVRSTRASMAAVPRPARRAREEPGASARIVAGYYAQEGRWSELVTLLGRELVQLDGVARIQALRRIARVHRHYLHDPASAEQALRVALAQPGDDEGTLHDRQLLHGELVTCLEMQGRFAEAVAHLEAVLQSELSSETGETLAEERAELLVRLARLARDGLDDEARAAPAFAALLRSGAAPDDGLASLARVYRASGQYGALAEVLGKQLRRVDRERELERAGELHRRLAELLDGPLARPGEAAPQYLAAYLADPVAQEACGARARALLSTHAVDAAMRHEVAAGVLATLPADALREVQAWTLTAEAAAAAGGLAEAEALFRAALVGSGLQLAGEAGDGKLSEGTGDAKMSEGTGDFKLSEGTGDFKLSEGTGKSALSEGTVHESAEAAGGWLGAPEDDGSSAAIGAAAAGLGRLLMGLGRRAEAGGVLAFAAGRRGLKDAVAVECGLAAAGAAMAEHDLAAAEAVLLEVSRARPVDARVLLELSKVYDLQERRAEEDAVLASLLSSAEAPALRAEVLLRRAQLRDYAADPRGVVGGEALALLQAAFAEDPRHVDARDALRALAEARGAWSVVVQAIVAGLRGVDGPERALLLLDLAEVHLLHLRDPETAARSLERAFVLAPDDGLVRGRTVTLLTAVQKDMSPRPDSEGRGFDAVAWLRAIAGAAELGDGGRASVWLTLGEVCLRAQDLAGAGAAWQQVFALASPGDRALAEARRHLETLGQGGDLQAQRVALQRLLAGEEQAEERLPILARLWEIGQALADEALVEASCREALALTKEAVEDDELREAAAIGLRGVLARRGAVAEIAALYAGIDEDMWDPERAARVLVDAARFAGQVVHDGELAATLACRAWRRAPESPAAQAVLGEIAEHTGHGSVLLAMLGEEDLSEAPGLALRLAEAAVRLGRRAEARRWLTMLTTSTMSTKSTGPETAGVRRAALARLDALLTGFGSAVERLPVLRARVAELGARLSEGAGTVNGEAVAGDRSEETGLVGGWAVAGDRSEGTGSVGGGAVAGDRSEGAGLVGAFGDVLEDRSEAAGLVLALARLELVLGEPDAALATCLPGPVERATQPELLELAAELLSRREQWAEVTAVCERRAELAAQAGERAVEAAWWTRAAQVCIDHATHPRRAMQDARRLLLRACAADGAAEAARAMLVPLSFAEQRWDEVLQVAGELRALAGEDYDVQIVAALTEALVHGRATLARAIGGRHEAATLRRMLWPALARVLGEVARTGTLAQLDAVLAAASALQGSAARLRVELQAWSAGRTQQPGLTLGLARLHESIGHTALARAQWQLVAFMVPQGPIAAQVAGLPALAVPADVLANDREPALESREALRAVLRRMASETAGIRAHGEPPVEASTPEEHEALALAEAQLGPLRAAIGLPLPLLLGRGGPDGGVSVRNEAPPAIVVSAAIALLPPAERRFRLALAAAMIASGLAVVTDPQGASLPELLAALLHLADETCPARLPGAQTIVRACAARGFTRERLPAGLREALAREVSRWQQNRGSLIRLAHLLRRDNLRVATRLSGSLDGALRTLGRDARLLPPGVLDERSAMQVLASEDAQWLLRSLGVFA